MTVSTSVCVKCAQVILPEAGVYSAAGELICSSCNQAAVAVELEQRGQASARRGRIALGVVVAVVVMVPTTMFLAGLGQRMGEAMIVLGGGCLFGSVFAVAFFLRRRMLKLMTFPTAHIAALAAIGVVVAGAGYGVRGLAGRYHGEPKPLAVEDPHVREARAAAGARAEAGGPQATTDRHALEEQKQAVEKDPSSFLEASEIRRTASDIVDEKSTMDALTVVNNSRFALWKIQGVVDWMDGDRRVASMGFTVKERALMPKEPRRVTTDAGTLETDRVVIVDGKAQAKVTRAVVRFTQAVVKE